MRAAEPGPTRLSILLTCTEEWPAIQVMLDSLLPQVVTGVEVLVLASVPRPVPAGWQHPAVRVVSLPGSSTFHLRARGLAEAQGRFIAISEDHARVGPGWIQAILAAHQARPEATAVVGRVGIGAPARRAARAHHVYLFADYTTPLDSRRMDGLPLANISFRRDRLLADDREPEAYWLEGTALPRLHARGEAVFAPEMLAYHTQDFGTTSAVRAHYHNARSAAGFAGRPRSIPRAAYHAHGFYWDRLRTARGDLRHIDGPLSPLLATALLLPIYAANVVGTLLGWLRGPGRSPAKVH